MRLVTRGNLDGLTCAVLIDHADNPDSIELIHPQDITDNKFEILEGDILANVPYHPSCSKWFDHHSATRTYRNPPTQFEGSFAQAPSTARLVYDYYLPDHPRLSLYDALVKETDRYDMEDVVDPKGFVMLGFTMDPRTGLGDYREYFLKLVEAFRDDPSEGVLEMPQVRERAARMSEERAKFLDMMRTHSKQVGNVIVTDLREAGKLPVGNRFLVYTLFPDANVSLRIAWGPGKRFVAATVGHSIFNRSCPVHVGELLAKYGGGGHRGAGATPLNPNSAEQLIDELTQKLNQPPTTTS